MLVSREIFDRWGARPEQYVCAWWMEKAANHIINENGFQLQECSDNCNYRNHEGGVK